MNSKWPVKKLGDLIVFSQLGLVKSKNELSDSGFPYLKMDSISLDGSLDLNKKVKVKVSDNEIKNFTLKRGDFLFNTRNSPELVGKSAVFDNEEHYLFNNNILRLQLSGLLPLFLDAYLHTSEGKQKLNSIKKGTTSVSAIYQSNLFSLNIPVPSMNIQKKIVERLDAIRKAQELCDQQIQKTEELFESLLINEFKNQKEWQKKKLPEVANVQRGKFTPRPRNDPKYFGGDIPWIQTGDITNADGVIDSYSQTLNEEGLKVSRIFPKGTIVITIAANIGDLAILEIDVAFPDSIVGITVNESMVNNKFLYFQMLLQKDYLNNQATQAAQKNINLQVLSVVDTYAPSLKDQQKIVEKLEVVQNYKKLLLKQKAYLKELFDSVLDKSMKGEMDN